MPIFMCKDKRPAACRGAFVVAGRGLGSVQAKRSPIAKALAVASGGPSVGAR